MQGDGNCSVIPSKKGKNEEFRLRASAARTQAVLNVVCGIEGIDMQLMPASFKVLQSDFHWALQDLGSLVFYQSASQAIAGLIWGVLADRSSRVQLLSLGCAGWGIVSIFLGSSTAFWQFALLKVLNGIAMASIGPVAQSLIADLFPPTMRGEHYGWLQLFLCAGCIMGAMIGGSVANITAIEGVKGWRLAFFSAGVLSLFVASLVQLLAKEPPRNQVTLVNELPLDLVKNSNKQQKGAFTDFYQRCHNFCRAALSRTFLLLLLQGVCGYIPLHAFQFYTLYFQYVGMPDWQASLLTACPLVGGLLGSLFGGWLGDQAERWSEFHGRPLVGQLGTLLALPLIYIGLLGIPRRPEFFGLYAIDMLVLGFAISWCPSGVNRPILSEIVEPDSRATVFATQIAVEGSVSALLGSPVIALLGVPFHAAAERERNTDYGLMHFTYPKDAIAYETFRAASTGMRTRTDRNYTPPPAGDPMSASSKSSK
ncbi:major facilitator family protein [Cyclospora cayetanensis]|uniref:Major facilitator family protein n=1 Tax=Cyclospora cayetanensis TaxID=88456 RepID=A0A1D3D6J0_9EIME|nr:major facilitator family protein [Cyclospora cayetanensis]